MRSRVLRVLPAVAVAALASTQPDDAAAFDWNGRTVTAEIDVIDGRIDVESGHPLATARAFELAAAFADEDPELAVAFTFVFSSPFHDRDWQSLRPADLADHRGDGLQTVIFGNWLNEVRTSLDMDDPGKSSWRDPLEWVAKVMGWRYARYLEGRERSDLWSEATGYSSNNYQHSMQVSSSDPARPLSQADTFDVMEEYLTWALDQAMLQLIFAKKAQLEIGVTDPEIDDNWVSGLRRVGSLFHVIEDSSVTCSPAAQRLVPSCVPGDGHTIVDTISGQPQVVTLSDNSFYERRVDGGEAPHGLLDALYREENLDAIYGEFDPALVNAQVIVEVSLAVHEVVTVDLADVPMFRDGSDELNPEFVDLAAELASDAADEVYAVAVEERFAAEEDRRDLPPLPDGDDKSDDVDGASADEGEDTAAGCRVAGGPGGALALLLLVALARRRPAVRRATW